MIITNIFTQANTAFRNHEYETAIELYELILKEKNIEPIKSNVLFNYELARSRINSRSANIKSTVKKSLRNLNINEKPKFEGFGIVRHNPLVSIIIVSYNSINDLKTLLPTLQHQTYQNFELLILENGEEDNEEICKKYFDKLKYYKRNNIGFAAGNNYCYERSNGEFITLINPDTKLDKNFLQELIDAVRFDEHAAIVAPKINFFEKFVSLVIEADHSFSMDISNLLDHLNYKKYFVRSGENKKVVFSDENNIIKIDVPHPNEDINIPISILTKHQVNRIKVTIGYESGWQSVNSSKEFEIALTFNKKTFGGARFLINNAGSGIRENDQPYDRGFGEYEDGQYLTKTYLSAFCGCAALIRRSAILKRKIFIDEFFAYYEDSELSWWIQKEGFKILYCPTALIYHRHSESTEENSEVWKALVSRSFKLYSMISSNNYNESHEKFINNYTNKIPTKLAHDLSILDRGIAEANTHSDIIKINGTTVCIYNSYFSSMGGGEKHALDFASILQKDYQVYLASEIDFDIDKLSSYFDINLSQCKKLISTRIDTHFSSMFDVFINSTYHSNLIPAAKLAYYIVSFPHKHIDQNLLNKYYFLHNSPYTSRWAHKYWGKHNSSLVMPIIGFTNKELHPREKKSQTILSVGRLTSEGHCKNHHLVIEAFKLAIDKKLINSEWELVIAGSCDLSNAPAVDYYHMLQQISIGYKIRVEINLSRSALESLYKLSFIYIHATGLGSPLDEPEKHEHFGITPHEAMRFGCYPLVYFSGGPSEQIIGLFNSKVFTSLQELASQMGNISSEYNDWETIFEDIQSHVKKIEYLNKEVLNSLIKTIKSDLS